MSARERTDRLLSLVADGGAFAVRVPGVRQLLVGCAAVIATLAWPWSPVRLRARADGVAVRPWTWGAQLGRTFVDLLGARRADLVVDGWDTLPRGGRGGVVLGAHLGPWEAGAAELARRGLRPAVIAAPWPRLPKTERRVAALRADSGVASIPRGTAGWREATRHLRGGGAVVVLVDSASPRKRGRREVPFVDGGIGAPDAVIAWADRHDADVWVALGRREGFEMRGLTGGAVEDRADRAVAWLRDAVRARPAQWAWVRALAVVALMVTASACGEDVPEVPATPDGWEVVAEVPRWKGALADGTRATFEARSAVVEWKDDAPHGRFQGIDVKFETSDGTKLGRIWASKANGTWPEGPIELSMVGWALETPKDTGSLDVVTYGPGGWSCGGCALEAFLK